MTDEVNSNINRNIYNNLSNDELIEVILGLKGEITKLNDDFKKVTNLRLYHLERNHNIYMQYGRRESFEIVGIPQDIPDDRLEDEVIEIMKEAKVLVNRQPLKKNGYCRCASFGQQEDNYRQGSESEILEGSIS